MSETYQDRLKRIKKQMSGSEESKVSSSESQSSGESYSERISRLKKSNYRSGVDDTFIGQFMNDVSKYQADVNNRYNGLTWSSAPSSTRYIFSEGTSLKNRGLSGCTRPHRCAKATGKTRGTSS